MQTIEFIRPDGARAPGVLAVPESGDDAPGVVVIQEWWGVNEQLKGVAQKLAQAGYRALIPDLYRGVVAKDAAEADLRSKAIYGKDAVEEDVRGAVRHLKEWTPGSKVACVGFCMGGALALHAGVAVPELDAVVCYYGIPARGQTDLAKLKLPLLAHFARKDDWCTPAAVDALEKTLQASGAPFQLHRYDAHHAFANERRPEVYDESSAKLAWDRTLAFLGEQLR